MKEKLKNGGIVLLFELLVLPLLGIITYTCYNRFVVEQVWGINQGVRAIALLLFIAINIGILYVLAKVYVKKLNVPLIYHTIIGLFPIFIGVWGYVYFKTVEKAACDGASLLTCSDAVIDLKKAQLMLIASIAYYFLFIVLIKMIKKQK